MMCRNVSTPRSCKLANTTDSRHTATNPEYSKFADLLSLGWIPGRLVDNSDQQYAGFRDNLPYLFIVMALHPLLRRIFDAMHGQSASQAASAAKAVTPDSNHSSAENRLNKRIIYDVSFSIMFLLALHGFSALKVLLILYINYSLATRLKKEHVPVATWVFNIGILFANELGEGYPFAALGNTIAPEQKNWGTMLDKYGGLIPRWEVLFNITVLRLISFNFDYYWSLNKSGGSPIEVGELYTCREGFVGIILTASRRSSWIPPIYQNGTELTYQPRLKTTHFAITLHTPCIRRYISRAQY